METPKDILKKIRHIELKTRGLVQAAFAGQYRSVFKGRGMNFEEVREYQPGDEVRTIDWNVTARMGHPYVKKFTEERELTVMLVVDASASGNYGSAHLSKRELAAEVACLLAFSAIRNNDKVGLIPKGRGTDAAAALNYLNRVVTRRSVVFLLSDFQTPDFSRELSVTSRRHDLVAIPVIDPREEELPDIGLVTLEDSETGELIEINTSDRALRAAYSHLFYKRRDELFKNLQRKRIDTISLKTNDDYLPALRTFFKNRERRLAVR